MMLPFGEFRPDTSDYETKFTRNVLNVVPQADGYGPFLGFLALSAALAAACRGVFYARNNDGSITIFAGTSTKLYKMSNTDFTWSDVSKGSSTYSAVPTGDQWQFAQFNNFVFAVQTNTVPQVYDLTSSTNFADLGGSPPQARYIAVVNRFLVLSGLTSSTPYRIQWSGLNATTTWTSGTNSSDSQDLPDGGIPRTIGGGEYGLITQDQAIRRMVYVGGAVVFQIERVVQDAGIYAPLSLVRGGDRLFYIATDGFKMIAPGGYPQPIGKERVDRTFFAEVDSGSLQLILGASDPKTSRVYWSYRSASSSASGLFDKILIYDYALERWSKASVSGEYLSTLASPGRTLENLDSINSSIDALTFSLDDVSTSVLAKLSGADSSHKVGFFSGDALEATLETSEHSGDGKRVYVNGFSPMTDAASLYGSVSYRDTPRATKSYTTETAVNSNNFCPARIETRLAGGKVRIPASTVWTYATGIEPEVRATGGR